MKQLSLILLFLASVTLGCEPSPSPSPSPLPSSEAPSPLPSASVLPSPSPSPSVTEKPRRVILWQGLGAWSAGVRDLKLHFQALGIEYTAVSSLVGIDYSSYSAFVMPGGNAVDQGKAIGEPERLRLKAAIQNGLNYLGHCAGAFITTSWSPYYLKLHPAILDYPSWYYTTPSLKIHVNQMRMASGEDRYILYYWGPDLTPVTGADILAYYRQGPVSMLQMRVGKGLVILTGGHPEASPATIQSLGLVDPDGSDADLEAQLLEAVIAGKEIP